MLELGVVIMVGSFALLAGYMLGIKAFNNIWIVSAVSISSILILEPIVAYSVFRQIPTKGAFIGFLLGAAGLIIALF